MLFNQLLHFMARLSLGKQLATALMLLRLIVDAVENRKVTDVARFVFKKLPYQWRHPEGPATETEFVELIQAGQIFLGKVKAVIKD